MLIAEIRKKLSDLDGLDPDLQDSPEAIRRYLSSRKEDLLTADVFGVLKYLPRDPFLKHLLNGVLSLNPHATELSRCLPKLSFGEEDFEFKFWPKYPTPISNYESQTEPDLEVVGNGLRIFVECKLHSGFGDLQIVRQLLIGLANAKHDDEFFLLLVTKGFRPPRVSYNGKKYEIHDYLRVVAPTLEISQHLKSRLTAAYKRVLWVNWRTMASLLRDCHEQHVNEKHSRCHKDLVQDLEELLKLRSLGQFNGFSLPQIELDKRRPVLARFLTEKKNLGRPIQFKWLQYKALPSTRSYRAPFVLSSAKFNFERIVKKMSFSKPSPPLLIGDPQ